MYCPECRTELPDDAKYCFKCGYDFRKIKTPPERKYSSDPLDNIETEVQPEIDTSSFEKGSLLANRYEILEEGKKGGMGVVYKCKDIKLNKIVALKIIHPKLLQSKQALSRFRQEVAISQELQHPHIVKVHELQEWDGKEYFTVEWVEGVTLREVIQERKKENRPFNLGEASEIIGQLADALQYAHQFTIHRDIKPENILIIGTPSPTPLPTGQAGSPSRGEGNIGAPPLRGGEEGEGVGFSIKLTDFGIAKMLSPSQFTSTSIQMGTPYYMAPEQKVDAANVDKRADIYACGVVLFELLTLENTIGLKLPSQMIPALPKEIDGVLVKALEMKPEDRYVSTRELSSALGTVLTRKDEQRSREEEEERQREEEVKRQKEEAQRKPPPLPIASQPQWISSSKLPVIIIAAVLVIGAVIYMMKPGQMELVDKGKAAEQAGNFELALKYYTKAKTEYAGTVGIEGLISGAKGKIAEQKAEQKAKEAEKIAKEKRKLEEDKRLAEEAKRKEEERKRAPEGMVFVEGGCFQMGDTFGDGKSDEKPVHEVCVDNYFMGKYEVSQGQWKEVMGSNPSNFSSCGYNCPVEQVSWNEVQEFIRKLNNKGGSVTYRLPTEAEWEYACRSGGKSERHAGSSDFDSVAWYGSNSGYKTHAVGQKQANGLGLYDMSGNVREWVSDWYGHYSGGSASNPKGSSNGSDRVNRGGSWGSGPGLVRCAGRSYVMPGGRDAVLGFRLAGTR